MTFSQATQTHKLRVDARDVWIVTSAVTDGRPGEVGVTSLGADSTTKLYAGFTSIPVEADWIANAILSLRAA